MATAELESLHPLRKNNKRWPPIWRQPALSVWKLQFTNLWGSTIRDGQKIAPLEAPFGKLLRVLHACVDIDYGVFTSIRDKSIIISIHGLPRGLLAVSATNRAETGCIHIISCASRCARWLIKTLHTLLVILGPIGTQRLRLCTVVSNHHQSDLPSTTTNESTSDRRIIEFDH